MTRCSAMVGTDEEAEIMPSSYACREKPGTYVPAKYAGGGGRLALCRLQ